MGPFNGSFTCMDCDTDTRDIDEWYMVSDELWLLANPQINGVLCIGCLEGRIGRRLTVADFNHRLLNLFTRNGARFSERLVDRALNNADLD